MQCHNTSAIELSNAKSRSCPQRGTKVNGSHYGDNPLLKPTGIQTTIFARSNQPRTRQNYWRKDDVFGYELQFLLSGGLPVFHNPSRSVASVAQLVTSKLYDTLGREFESR